MAQDGANNGANGGAGDPRPGLRKSFVAFADQQRALKAGKSWRQRIHELIEVAREDDRASQLVDMFLATLIVLNVIAFVMETVPEFAQSYGAYLHAFELFSVSVFTLEYVLRLWSCVEMPFLSRMDPTAARMRFARRPYLLIDLLAIAPFYLATLLPFDLRILRVLRIFRILKLTRYSPTMHTLFRVISSERRTLIGTFVLLMTLLLFISTMAYYAERVAQPDKFGSIPEAMWWAMATLTTVGYGDITPITPIGKLIGGLGMIAGIVVLALPIAIIANGFSAEVGKRDFVITWSLLSRVPVLAELETEEIGKVMRFLNAQYVEAHRDVISPDDRAEAMYFVVSGAVRMKTLGGETIFDAGDFFGELAMLEDRDHTHSYRTTTETKLLRLTRDDFQYLSEIYPRITDKIASVAKARRAARDLGRADPTEETVAAAPVH